MGNVMLTNLEHLSDESLRNVYINTYADALYWHSKYVDHYEGGVNDQGGVDLYLKLTGHLFHIYLEVERRESEKEFWQDSTSSSSSFSY